MRLRSVRQAIAQIKESDPGTSLTETILRKMVADGDLPAIKFKSKFLIDMDTLESILKDKTQLH